MIDYIDSALQEYAEIINSLGSGFPEESITYRIQHEGAGASIRGQSKSSIPIPLDYRIERYLVRLQKAISGMRPWERKILDVHYRIYSDPVVDKIPRHLLSKYKKRTYYTKLHKIHVKINEDMKDIRIST